MDAGEKAAVALSNMQQQAGAVYKGYLGFTKTIAEYGPLDVKTQELILIACAMMSQCEMCISLHVQNGAAAGLTKEEIVQGAMLAISMGGSPKMMYMRNVFEEVADLFD
jgi:AhpD family alkylhydroperoxidase